MNWEEIIKFLGVFGISATTITLIIGFLGKRYIELVSQKKLDQAKNDLLMQATEFQIKSHQLHTERLDVIKGLYSKLSELNDHVFIMVIAGKGDISEQNKIEKLYQLYYDLRIDFNRNKILFNRDVSSLISDTITKIHSSLFNFNNIVESSEKIKNETDIETIRYYESQKRRNWDTAAKLIEEEVPKLLERLENEFRGMLGVK